MFAIDGEEFTFPIAYEVDDQFVIPTAAWATVRDSTGAILIQDEVLSVDSTSTQLVIPATHNTLPAGARFEYRYVIVTFNWEGRPYRRELHYPVRPFVPLAVTPADVRAELGLDASELPDDQVDLHGAYLTLIEDYGSAFSDALTSSDGKASHAQRAIAVREAIEITFSLPFRAGVKFSSEESQFQRMSEFDPVAIRILLGQKLAGLLDRIFDETTGGAPILIVATPVDPITGA